MVRTSVLFQCAVSTCFLLTAAFFMWTHEHELSYGFNSVTISNSGESLYNDDGGRQDAAVEVSGEFVRDGPVGGESIGAEGQPHGDIINTRTSVGELKVKSRESSGVNGSELGDAEISGASSGDSTDGGDYVGAEEISGASIGTSVDAVGASVDNIVSEGVSAGEEVSDVESIDGVGKEAANTDSEVIERLVNHVEWDQITCDSSVNVVGKLRGVRNNELCVLKDFGGLPVEARLFPDLTHGTHYPLNFSEEMRKRLPLKDPENPGKYIWFESSWFTFIIMTRGSQAFVHGGNGYVADSAGFGYHNNKWYHSFPKNPKVVALKSPVASFCVKFGSSIQHFAMDIFPKVSAALPWLKAHPDVSILISKFRKSDELLSMLGIPLSRVVYANSATVYSAPSVAYVDFYAGGGTIAMGSSTAKSCIPGAELLNKNLAAAAGREWTPAGHPSRNKIIYLSRGNKSTRRVTNHLEILALGKQLKPGFELVEFKAGATAVEDQAAMSEAAAVLGPHGGAWLNLMYLPPGIPVIEFINFENVAKTRGTGANTSPRPCYLGMAYCFGLPYYNVESPDFGYTQSSPFTVPIDEVKDRLRVTGLM